jgi:hypothetical protein
MRWAEIAAHEPALGAVAHERLIKPGVLLIGTTRRDGSARISGVEPLVMDGELWLSMMPGSAKVADLVGDFALFAVDIDEVTYVGFAPGSGDQHVARWPQGEEYLRPATSATKLGAKRPVRRVLSAAGPTPGLSRPNARAGP